MWKKTHQKKPQTNKKDIVRIGYKPTNGYQSFHSSHILLAMSILSQDKEAKSFQAQKRNKSLMTQVTINIKFY